jgi:hypothetical protein
MSIAEGAPPWSRGIVGTWRSERRWDYGNVGIGDFVMRRRVVAAVGVDGWYSGSMEGAGIAGGVDLWD